MKNSTMFAPTVSILAPAYNEEKTIVDSIKSFLLLDYPRYEVIVINDGSKDKTVEEMIKHYHLVPADIPFDNRLSKTKIRAVYRSELHPNLILIDKENGGKADALNVGIGFSSYEYFCGVDSDSLLETDAILRMAAPFIEDPRVVACGGIIRVANEGTVKYGRMENVGFPKSPIVLFQLIEYIRSFLCGRIAWNYLNSTLIISGAFGMFHKDTVIGCGGYLHGSVGEDMELVVRIHRYLREKRVAYRVVFTADPVCWTEVPTDMTTLSKQRNRWQRGLMEVLFKYRSLFMNPRYGFIGLLAVPYFFIVELFGPVIEVLGVSSLIYLFFNNQLDIRTTIMVFQAGIVYGVLNTLGALLLEEQYFGKYPALKSIHKLLLFGLLENFGWRQLMSFYRLKGMYSYLTGDKSWGKMPRTGFAAPTKKG